MNLKNMTKEQFDSHIQIDRYGDFHLCGVRPGIGICPKQGFAHAKLTNGEITIPTTVAAVSREIVLDVFHEMLDLLEDEVTVILGSQHKSKNVEFWGEIDLVVLKSVLMDYEDLLLNDGLCGISVYSHIKGDCPIEVQIDFHKFLVGYGEKEEFNQIFEMYGLVCDEDLKLISDGDHVHLSSSKLYDKFLELVVELGVEGGMRE